MICVVDASVAIKWFVAGDWAKSEDQVDRAIDLLMASRRNDVRFVQPPHFLAEVAAVLARAKPRQARDDLVDLMSLEIEYVESPGCYERAISLAVELDHHVFDTLYHALALEHDSAVLVTADRRYYAKAASLGSIAWLPGFAIPGH